MLSLVVGVSAVFTGLLNLVRELFGLMFLIERPDQLLHVAVHDIIELVQGKVDTVIGDAALGKVVSSDALGAVSGTHLQLARLGLGTLLLLSLGGQQP